MNPVHFDEWQPIIERIAEVGGRVLVVGGVDSGKTTFCAMASAAAAERGLRAAVVDADIGQSEIGPPCCVGWGLVDGPVRNLSDIPPAGLEFVGSTAPRGNLLEHVTATRLSVDAGEAAAANVVLVDTTGYIEGAEARRLKNAKIRLVRPRHVVVLQRKDECEHLLQALGGRKDLEVHRLPVPPSIGRKSAAIRAQRRAGRFSRYFADSEIRFYPLEGVALTGTWINSGSPLAPHLIRFIANSLRVPVFYAEERNKQLGIVTSGAPASELGMATVQEQFRARAIAVTAARDLRHLVVGLGDHEGRMMGLGLIEAVDFRKRELGILTPVRGHAGVRLIHFGQLRVDPTGKEHGFVRPGEL